MDRGVLYVKDNFEKSIEICRRMKPALVKIVLREYKQVGTIRYTGNLVEYFERYKDGHAAHAKDFRFLTNEGAVPNELMADKLRSLFQDECRHAITTNNIEIGDVLSHYELLAIFKGNRQGLFREDKDKKTIALVLNDEYNDFSNSGTVKVLLGKNNKTTRSRINKLIGKNRRYKVFVFRKKATNKYEYLGEYKYVSKEEDANFYWIKLNQVKKNKVYPCVPWDNHHEMSEHDIDKAKGLEEPSEEELREKAKSYSRLRDKRVAEYTKRRARGVCDLCDKKGPFKNKHSNEYYLECHHIIQVGAYGPDRIYNTVALCPNCHRKIHHLNNASDKELLINKLREYLERDNDSVNLSLFNKLFGF